MSTSGNAHFRTTRWSLVRSAGARTDEARASLEELCASYWYPLYAFARRRGKAREEAEDTIQSFFAQLLERDDFATADPQRGRFRAFLSGALRHHMANEWDHATAEKRGGGRAMLSIDWEVADERFGRELAVEKSPEELFERDWALSVLDSALDALRLEYTEREQDALFEVIAVELGGGASDRSRAEQASDLGMTEGSLKTAISRARTRFRDRLREVVADTLADPADADQELMRLFDALG